MAFTTKTQIDPTNYPSLVTFKRTDDTGTIFLSLPPDVIITLDDDKVIAESKILDGVEVFERISRKSWEINFDFNIRDVKQIQLIFGTMDKYVFPQKKAEEIVNNIWNIDQVFDIENTFLNGIGINQVIVKSITFATIRGNTNLPCTLKCKENADIQGSQGSSLIINSNSNTDFTL